MIIGYIIMTRRKGTKQRFKKAGPYVWKTRKEAIRMALRGLGESRIYYDIKARKVKSRA